MSNMSYCRFRNTLADLQDCADALYELGYPAAAARDDELEAATALLKLCRTLADDFTEEDGEILT